MSDALRRIRTSHLIRVSTRFLIHARHAVGHTGKLGTWVFNHVQEHVNIRVQEQVELGVRDVLSMCNHVADVALINLD